jgi:acetaldehyde dehydrogenase (acetylating)
MVLAANEGTITTSPGEAEVANLSYTIIIKSEGRTQYVDLYSSGQLNTMNSSNAAAWLIEFVNLECGRL